MNTLMTLAAAACALTLSAGSLAAAQEREPTAVKVAVSAAELRDAPAVDKAYARLRRGAREACNSNSLFDHAARREDRACAARALDLSVARLAQPMLTARHEARSGPMMARGY